MSDLFKLNFADIFKGFVVAFLTVFTGSLMTVLQNGALPTLADIQGWAIPAAAAGLAYIIKNLFTGSDGKILSSDNK